MRTLSALVSTVFVSLLLVPTTSTAQAHKSQYSGQQTRAIKSLSPDDIAELERGGGWGLAKAAELNGLPGPAHLLELKKEIGLSVEQTKDILALYHEMKAQAIELGARLITQEQELEHRFRSNLPSETELSAMLFGIGKTRAKLRLGHLSAHLKTPYILTKQQIATYNAMRGYGSQDPCANPPKGHDAPMWRKHNGCK